MKPKLNELQNELLNKAKEIGYLTLNDFETIYCSPITIKHNIKRFILLGFLKEVEKDKFEYIKQEDK